MSLLYDASLIITPNAYKESKLYALKPQSGLGDMTVTRATTATRVNSDGLVELVPYNLLTYSEQFDNTAWVKANVSISANTTTAPNGTLTADSIIENSALATHVILQSATLSPTTYTYSVYVKSISGSSRNVGILFNGTGKGVLINPINGSVVVYFGTTSTDVTITSFANGWFRVSVTATTAAITESIRIYLGSGTTWTAPYQGDGTSGAYIWGAQLVQGSTPKDYFPTTNRLNVPRIDYSNGGCPSILVEPQRTNLLLRSEEFNNAYWNKNSSSVIQNAIISPSGDLNADKLYPNTTGSVRGLFAFGFPLNTYTFSVYAKKGEKDFLYFFVVGSTTVNGCFFNLNLGTIGTVGAAWSNVTITNVGNGWYRCSAVVTIVNASNNLYYFVSDNNNDLNVTANGTDGIYLWGAQLEAGAYPTSYIPTIASTVTRNADVISKTGVSSLIGQTEGTVFLDFYYRNFAVDFLIFIQNSLSNYLFRPRIGATGVNVFNVSYTDGSGGAVLFTPSVTLTPFTRNKIAVVYDSVTSTTRTFANGVFVGQINLVGIFPINQDKIDIGISFGASPKDLNNVLLSKTKISDAQAIELTTP